MLIACSACHRQYDVGDLHPGSHVRCLCGEISPVPERKPEQARVLHCSRCGGAIQDKGESCSYCGATLAAESEHKGDPCPECFGPMAEAAQFCSTCGVAIAPQAILKAVSDTDCPRCQAKLTIFESPESSFYECTECAGVWLPAGVFEEFAARRGAHAKPQALPSKGPNWVLPRQVRTRGKRKQDGLLRCPVCKAHMLRLNYAAYSGVMVDRCESHGFWFDGNELEQIGEFIERGGLLEARQRDLAGISRKRTRRRRRRMQQDRQGRQSEPDNILLYVLSDVVEALTGG